MANLVLTVKRVVTGVDFYTLVFNEKFDGFVEVAENQYAEAQIDSISFNKSYLHQSVINLVTGVDLLYSAKKSENKSFAPTIMALLKNATVTINRDKFNIGDKYVTLDGEEKQHEYQGYSRDIIDIQVTKAVSELLDNVINQALSL